jgi:predicted RND superfamily exporter protein
MEKELALSIVRGQNYSQIFAAVAIALLLFLIFRSANAGLMGSLPLAFALISNFGLMGWLGIELDIATSLLSSIAIGIGIDYTIHLFWRLQAELREGLPYPEAIMKTLRTTGRGITINAFSVMLGFSVLFFSALSLLKAFALLIVFSLLLCLLCALALIPALSIWLRPKFLEKKNKNHENSIANPTATRIPAELPR